MTYSNSRPQQLIAVFRISILLGVILSTLCQAKPPLHNFEFKPIISPAHLKPLPDKSWTAENLSKIIHGFLAYDVPLVFAGATILLGDKLALMFLNISPMLPHSYIIFIMP